MPSSATRARRAASSGPAPATRSVARSRRATASRSTWTPLWGSSRPTYPMTGTSPAGPSGAWREALGVDAQRDQGGRPGEPLALADAARLGVAHAQRGGVAQGPPLEPAERRWVALVDVLGGVQDVRRPLAAQPPQQQDLGRRQGERLLVDVDDVVRPPEGAPQRQRRVHEEGRVASPRAEARHRLARAGDEGHVGAALVPPAGGQEVDVGAESAQVALPLPPRVHDGAVEDSEDPHFPHSPRRIPPPGYR